MKEKYIRRDKKSYKIIKNSRVYGRFSSIEDAIFARDLLEGKNWNPDNFTLETHLSQDKYVAVAKIDEKLHILGKFNTRPNDKELEKLAKKIIRNPNKSKYGLNISRVFEIFMVKKQIAGDSYIFAVSDNLEDATFIRNFLLENSWDVNTFPQIAFDDETDTYKISEVIDDKVWVIGSFDSFETARQNIEKSRREFLLKIYKNKFALANHPHLNSLSESIDEIERDFNIKVSDEKWNFENISQDEKASDVAVKQIIFNLTPWQKIIYDSISGEFTFSQLEKSLARYKSKNFERKIRKYLDELIELNLVEKFDDDHYRKV
ncbi:hypothetical protein [Methanobrevibacter sp.]|uniref:hypothetical protein n=1 Tax=Methanobrevibacter sp. TaxID=66852 RepID=UPI0026E0D7F8|nr:hypothetical protein [Methanobrevibacter sp.]MDO5859553.1 hypothetical protein [Methanobrevibacter sp.]